MATSQELAQYFSELLETVFSTNLDKNKSIRLMQSTYFLGRTLKPSTKQPRNKKGTCPVPSTHTYNRTLPQIFPRNKGCTLVRAAWKFPCMHDYELCCIENINHLSLTLQIQPMDTRGFVPYSETPPPAPLFIYIYMYKYIYIQYQWDTGKEKQKQKFSEEQDWKVLCILDGFWHTIR